MADENLMVELSMAELLRDYGLCRGLRAARFGGRGRVGELWRELDESLRRLAADR